MAENNTSNPIDKVEPISRSKPFWAEVIRHDQLTKPGSLKDTRHLVLSLGDSGLTYLPGDSLGAFGSNSPQLVNEVIGLLGFDPDYPLRGEKGDSTFLREALTRKFILNRSNRKIMSALAERVSQ